MRITEINIKNYRQYESLSLSFPEKSSHDLHIIIAQNGIGKTNLLNSITWCLYGKEPHLGSDVKEQRLPILNLNVLKEANLAGKCIEYVEVEIRAKDEDKFVTFKRSLPVSLPNVFELTAKEKFIVTIASPSGDPKIYEDKNDTKRIVDQYMPEKIREYFCFDGEQLNNYFMTSKKGKIRDAIFSISQVDIVNLIGKRLDEIIKDKQKEASFKAPKLKEISDELDKIDEVIKSYKEKISDLEAQIDNSKKIIKENSEFLQGEENLPELEEQYQRLKRRGKN